MKALLRVLLILLASVGSCAAHPLAPTLYDVVETQAGRLQVQWKSPRSQASGNQLQPEFPAGCAVERNGVTQQAVETGLLTRFSLACAGALRPGDRFAASGLETSPGGVLLRVKQADGSLHRQLLDPRQPQWQLPEPAAPGTAFLGMVGLGVEHLLGGLDHLLFVLCLVLLVPQPWRLLGLLTAFTAGHSVTLALASLGWIQLPGILVEASIALSIVVLAAQLGERLRGDQAEPAQTLRRPWLTCTAFGLLHGLGFAGALAEVGLPQDDLLQSLLGFNLGIELGQVAVVAAALLALALLRRLDVQWPLPARLAPVYLIGSCAGFWVCERLWPVV